MILWSLFVGYIAIKALLVLTFADIAGAFDRPAVDP